MGINFSSRFTATILAASLLIIGILPGIGQAADEDLAKKLSNPVADLISVPLQGNYDGSIGPKNEGQKIYVNVQLVIPVSIAADWNMISRTILPVVIEQKDIYPGAGSLSGLGDTTQSLFFSPKQPTGGGLIWGLGPVLLLPTGTRTGPMSIPPSFSLFWPTPTRRPGPLPSTPNPPTTGERSNGPSRSTKWSAS